MCYQTWKWIMLVLSNLFLCITTTSYSDTSDKNITNRITNKSDDDIIPSENTVTFNNLTKKSSESDNTNNIINITQKEIDNVNLFIEDSKNGKQMQSVQFVLDLDKEGIGRLPLSKSIRENIPTISERVWPNSENDSANGQLQREIDDAADLGLSSMRELLDVKEPMWYRMGLFLDKDEPASRVANFGKPSRRALGLSRFAYATLEASKTVYRSFPSKAKNEEVRKALQSRVLQEDCPLRGRPRCPPSTKLYRTPDGTCNQFAHPWRGAALLPMQRFLPPQYDDDVQEPRRSKSGRKLPSARDISVRIHRDKNQELPTVTLMFVQWGQFVDHDLVSTVKSRSFNGSIPRCCERNGENHLPLEFMHPSCLPIDVSDDDWVLGRFSIRCLEFIRSAPATRLDCDLGWREQMNQVTSYLDASVVYGSDFDTSDGLRTFKNGKLQYGRPLGIAPLNPPDPPGGELCRSGALTTECFEGGDGRFGEQSALTAMHTVWIRYHNKLATTIGKINKHWSDEKIFQETRKIVGALIQHITYREFLPIVVGPEVMELFELNLSRKEYYTGYNERINPAIANSFGAAAFRFGHSLVQNSYVRFDRRHRPLFNNVSLHQEQENLENIWSFGSVDRLLLGLVNQPAQRRDEFICEELTNNLFRSPRSPFGVDLAAINIQRGRDHGLPPYTSWRKPCGLSEIKNWNDLQKVLSIETSQRLRLLYEDVDDIDLFTAGLAEKPVRGGIVGPTFACIIAQQFSNLRKGDRFWYENSGFHSSFTPSQLNQIRRITLSEILCHTMSEFDTVQPFVFLSADDLRNVRVSCDNPLINKFDLEPWTEDIEPISADNSLPHDKNDNDIHHRDIKDLFDFDDDFRIQREAFEARKRKRVSTTRKPSNSNKRYTITKTPSHTFKIPISNVSVHSAPIEKYYGGYDNYDEIRNPQSSYYQPVRYTTEKYYSIRDKNDYTYLFGRVPTTTPVPKTTSSKNRPTPLEVNIKIQYYPPVASTNKRKQQTIYARPQNSNGYGNGYSNSNINRPSYQRPFQDKPTLYRPNSYDDEIIPFQRPNRRPTFDSAYSFAHDALVLQPVYVSDKTHTLDDTNQHEPNNYDEEAQPSVNYFLTRPHHNDGEIENSDENIHSQDDETDKQYTPDYIDKPNYYTETDLYEKGKGEPDRTYNTEHNDKNPTNDQVEFDNRRSGNPYSIAYVEKLTPHNDQDKLDFRTKLVYKQKYHKSSEDDREDSGYIASVEPDGNEEQYEESDEVDRQQKASSREADHNLENEGFNEFEYEKIRLVDIDVLTEGKSQIRWKPYNNTEPEVTTYDFVVPELNQNIHASNEVPKKLKSGKNFDLSK